MKNDGVQGVAFNSQGLSYVEQKLSSMRHILLTLAYEETALINAMPVSALLIICIDVDVDEDNMHFILEQNMQIMKNFTAICNLEGRQGHNLLMSF